MSSGIFRQTASQGANQYRGGVSIDKGTGLEPGHTDQVNRYYGRSEYQPPVNPYYGRPVIDQTLGDQYGQPKYTMDLGLEVRDLVLADNEQPWTTIIMPMSNTNAKTIVGTIWSYNRRLPRPTPYHAPSPYITERYSKFSKQIRRYGEQIRMEADFFRTEEGKQNLMLKLTGIASDFIEGIRYDVMRAMLEAIDEYKRTWALQTYTEDPESDIRKSIALFASLNKAPSKENQLAVVTEQIERSLNDDVPGPYEFIVPPQWGIYMHRVNQTPAPVPYYFMKDFLVENGPTPNGVIGRNRYWEYKDITVETGAFPLRMLQRKVLVAEYYRSKFGGYRQTDLCIKLTGLMASDKDIGRMRNIILYSLDSNNFEEIQLLDMVKNSHIVPDTYKNDTPSGKKYRALLKYYRDMGDLAMSLFHPEGDTIDGDKGIFKGLSGEIRSAPMFMFYEPKSTLSSKGTFIRRIKYSGETDHEIQDVRDHINQGQVLCAKMKMKFSMTSLEEFYGNAERLRKRLRAAPCSDDYITAFLSVNNNGSSSFPMDSQTDYVRRWGQRSGMLVPQLNTNSEGYYNLPSSSGLSEKIPPMCDCAIGILTLANADPSEWPIAEAVRDHYELLIAMIDTVKLLPDSELVNPLNKNTWIHTDDEDIGILDVVYSNAVSQFWPPAMLTTSTDAGAVGTRGEKLSATSVDLQDAVDRINENFDDFDFDESTSDLFLFLNSLNERIANSNDEDDIEDLKNKESALSNYLDIISSQEEDVTGSLGVTTLSGQVDASGTPSSNIRLALVITPGVQRSIRNGSLTLIAAADAKTDYSSLVDDTSEDINFTSSAWKIGVPRMFHHSSFNMGHGITVGMEKNGSFGINFNTASYSSYTSPYGSSSPSSRISSLRSGARDSVSGLFGGGRRRSRSSSSTSQRDTRRHEGTTWTTEERRHGTRTAAFGNRNNDGDVTTDSNGTLRSGYKMVRRFNGSNMISKLRAVTKNVGDPITFFSIAAMFSRQDRMSDWELLVENRLHVAADFLMIRIAEVYTESAILVKAGLGMTAINNTDFKFAETVNTKTYHGHLTVHYGAVVTKKNWLLMLEDMRLAGYIQGKGTGFIKYPSELDRSNKSTGRRNKSIICYAQPIASSKKQPSILSFTGKWEVPDVVPTNLPESGNLYHGADWYNKLWGWSAIMGENVKGRQMFQSRGFAWPQVIMRGYHQVYDLNAAMFRIASPGEGHLAGSDYVGGVNVVNGYNSWFDTAKQNQYVFQ